MAARSSHLAIGTYGNVSYVLVGAQSHRLPGVIDMPDIAVISARPAEHTAISAHTTVHGPLRSKSQRFGRTDAQAAGRCGVRPNRPAAYRIAVDIQPAGRVDLNWVTLSSGIRKPSAGRDIPKLKTTAYRPTNDHA